MSLKLKNPVVIGKIGAVHGVLGWVKLFSFTEKKDSIFKYMPWFFQKNDQWIKIHWTCKKKKSFFLIKIKNINDRISAQKFVNVKIITEKHNLPVLKNNEYYWNDLINCQVISISGHYLGIVTHLIYTGSNDVLVIKNKKNIDILIPFLNKTIIKKVDIHNNIIEVDWNYIVEK